MIVRALFGFALSFVAAVAIAAAPTTPERPGLQVTTLDGEAFDLAAQRGNWVIVNYWATWCAPCIAEMPDISAFVAGREDVRAIGLAFEDTERAEIEAFLEKHPVVYPIAQVDPIDPPGDFAPPRGLPTTYLIAPDGRVAKRFTGPVDSADLAAAITATDEP